MENVTISLLRTCGIFGFYLQHAWLNRVSFYGVLYVHTWLLQSRWQQQNIILLYIFHITCLYNVHPSIYSNLHPNTVLKISEKNTQYS